MSSSEPAVEPWENGAAFSVKAHAGAKRDGVSGLHGGMLKVEVTTAPEKGRANKAIIKLLAKKLNVGTGDLVLLSGETGRTKRFGVRGIDANTLRDRILSLF